MLLPDLFGVRRRRATARAVERRQRIAIAHETGRAAYPEAAAGPFDPAVLIAEFRQSAEESRVNARERGWTAEKLHAQLAGMERRDAIRSELRAHGEPVLGEALVAEHRALEAVEHKLDVGAPIAPSLHRELAAARGVIASFCGDQGV